VPFGTGVFLRLLVGELGTPKLAQIFAYGKWLYPYRMLVHGASDLDQRCLKTCNSEDRCTFPPNIFAATPNHKTHFGGPFNAKLILRRALPKSHVNRPMKLKLYSYIGTYKYWGCQSFSLGASGGAGPLNINFGPPIISKTTRARKLNLKIPLDMVKYPL